MTDWPSSMVDVADRVRTLEAGRSIDAVAARLLEIEREKDGYRNPDRRPGSRRVRRVVKRPDGVACFNFMYLRVTEEVRRRLPEFEAPESVQRLAVVFAEFYLVAYGAARDHRWISKAWAPLVEEKNDKGILPLQFALAGMNAHINNDLAWALIQVWDELDAEPSTDSPEHRDFVKVDSVLGAVQAEVRATLQSGFLKWLDRVLGRTDDVLAEVVIAKARAEAWARARRWRGSVDAERAGAHDREVGYQTHLILGA